MASVPALPVNAAYRDHLARKAETAARAVMSRAEKRRIDDLAFFASRVGQFVSYRYGPRASPFAGEPMTRSKTEQLFVLEVDIVGEVIKCHGDIQLRVCRDGKWRRTYKRAGLDAVPESERHDFVLISTSWSNPMWTHRHTPVPSQRPGAVIGQLAFPTPIAVQEAPAVDYAEVWQNDHQVKAMRAPATSMSSLRSSMAGMRLSVPWQGTTGEAEGEYMQ